MIMANISEAKGAENTKILQDKHIIETLWVASGRYPANTEILSNVIWWLISDFINFD